MAVEGMLFNSHEFLLLFLPLTLAVSFRLRANALLAWICVSSCVFYAFAGHVWFLVPMAITTVLDFLVARRMARVEAQKARRPWLVLSLVLNLGLLAYFKYSGLLVSSLNDAARIVGVSGIPFHALQVVLPAGISFYTFQTMSYVIDVYRGHAHDEPNFWAYLAFVAFFPHLVAGPLTRHNQLIPQVHAIARTGSRPIWMGGIGLFTLGLAKKVVVADRIALWNDPLIGHVSELGMIGAWVCAFGYAMQIYFDFSGYSDMAIGLGRLFGIELPQNFDRPYVATDPSDFWRRWHITLSQWLRDYLYISLGGNRRGAIRTDINLMITMALGGLWHGANWTFMAWGVYHGALLIVHRRVRVHWAKLSLPTQKLLTFVLVCIGWVFFRATTLGDAATWLLTMSGARGLGLDVDSRVTKVFVCVAVALMIAWFAKKASTLDFSKLTRSQWAGLGIAAAVSVVMMNYSSRFLYFQF